MKKSVNPSPWISKTTDIVHQRRTRLNEYSALSENKFINSDSDLSVVDVRAWTLREPVSKRSYTVVKIQTRSGITGYGECAPLTSEEFSGAKKSITGIPVTSYEIASTFLAGFPKARAALNIAMLDIIGKVTKAPVFQVLGGPTRFKARTMTGLAGDSDSALINSMNRSLKAGFKAFMVPLPFITDRNQGQAYVLATRKRLETLRSAGGEDIDFVLEGNSQLTPGDAQMISNAIESFHVLWFDEPCPPINIGTLKKVSGENVTPIGLGRNIIDGSEIQNLLREDAVDIIRPDIGLNGISQIRKMAAIAEAYYVALGPVHNGGPIGTAAALHLAASIPNFFIQQIPFPEAEEDSRMRSELTMAPVEIFKEGFAELPAGQGLGIFVNEKNLEKYKETTFI